LLDRKTILFLDRLQPPTVNWCQASCQTGFTSLD
jgi:hypothetical protein